MAHANTSELFNCTPEEFFKIVSDYEHYNEFMSEVESCEVIKEEDGKKLVEFNINLIKKISYRLWMTETPFSKVSWVFESGDAFKVNNGSWTMSEEAGQTRATYDLEAKFNLFVPGPIAKAMVNVNLPNMMSSYHKRVSELYGK